MRGSVIASLPAESRQTRILLAVVGLLASLLSCADSSAQTTVTLYGIADGNIRVDHTAIGNLRSLGSGGEDATRFGLRGSEDLGGLKAIFHFEQDFDLGDNGVTQGDVSRTTASSPVSSTGGRLFGRRAVVGLESASFGALRIGRDTTAYYDTWKKADPFDAGTVGRAGNYGIGNVSRFDNLVTYESPRLAGLRFEAQFRPGESATDSTDTATRSEGNAVSASLTYDHGPLFVGVGVITDRRPRFVRKTATAGAVYDFGVAKLHALYFHVNRDEDEQARYHSYAIGATVPIGAFQLLGVVARVDNRNPQRSSSSGRPSHLDDAGFFALGTIYSLSKRTNLYLVGSRFVNHGGAAFVIEDNSDSGLYTSTNVPAGFDPWSAQLGVHYRF